MKLSKEQNDSIIKVAENYFEGEIPDEVLETVGGGRNIYLDEHLSIERKDYEVRMDYKKRKIDKAELRKFNIAVNKYLNYIEDLPYNTPERLFVYEEWRDDDTE